MLRTGRRGRLHLDKRWLVFSRRLDSVPNHSAKAIEIEDIEARVAELERAAEASKPVSARLNR